MEVRLGVTLLLLLYLLAIPTRVAAFSSVGTGKKSINPERFILNKHKFLMQPHVVKARCLP